MSNEKQETIRFDHVIKIPDETTFDYTDLPPTPSKNLEIELVEENPYIWYARYEPPYVIYGHDRNGVSFVTMYDFTKNISQGFETRIKLRRYIRKASFDSKGYSYLSTFEHEPHMWHYFRYDNAAGEATDYFDMNEVTGKVNTAVSDAEEEGNLLAWVGSTPDEENLYIVEMKENTPRLIHTIKLNRSVDTLTPLTIRNQCVCYVDWNPDTEKWYIRTYDIYKGEHSPDTCDFEMNAEPESPPVFDRELLVWLEENDEGNFLYIYSRSEGEKYLIDKNVQNPAPYYPYVSYVKDGKLFSFDFNEKKKLMLFESSVEKVISGEGGIMPYCYTEAEKYARIYMLRFRPVAQEEKMRFVTGSDGTMELERQDMFQRVGMDRCKIVYNGREYPELFAQDLGWPLAGICEVIGAELNIEESRNILGADVPEKFTVSNGNIRLTFAGKAVKNALGDGGASYNCIEVPNLMAIFIKQNIQIDLPDFLDALNIPWTVDTEESKLYICGSPSDVADQEGTQ